jgi:hypothetical protein
MGNTRGHGTVLQARTGKVGCEIQGCQCIIRIPSTNINRENGVKRLVSCVPLVCNRGKQKNKSGKSML